MNVFLMGHLQYCVLSQFYPHDPWLGNKSAYYILMKLDKMISVPIFLINLRLYYVSLISLFFLHRNFLQVKF